jgi:hypothetical protein
LNERLGGNWIATQIQLGIRSPLGIMRASRLIVRGRLVRAEDQR